MTDQSLDARSAARSAATSLIARLYSGHDARYGISTASCQVYDTAWVAMVAKTTDGRKRWLFPESFYYLLRTQSGHGSWGGPGATQTAAIMDTAAALLALLRHAKEPLQLVDVSVRHVWARIDRAYASLQSQLRGWTDVADANHIGVEMILPSLFRYLQQEQPGFVFDSRASHVLLGMRADKMSRFDPEALYGREPLSALHSLEAFVGAVDFDRLSHHLSGGSMMASPSSTAAYLMHASQWSRDAEAYLEHHLKRGAGHGDGGVPGTAPITYFEYSWVSLPTSPCASADAGFRPG